MQLNRSVTAIVTGGASGLGEATARELAGAGVRVAIFDMNKERGEVRKRHRRTIEAASFKVCCLGPMHEVRENMGGPLMPGDVATGTPQALSDWVVRGAFFFAIGATLPAMMRRGTTTIQQDRRNIRIEMEIRRALAHGEFLLFYQPIIDLDGGGIVGAEALLRWQHPERGLLLPADFIHDVEQIGSIANWVIQEAATTTARWRSTYRLDKFDVSVNVLCLEVTESAMIDDVENIAIRLQVLRSVGIKIAIGDCGTGHATLSYLQQLPIDIIKIDRSFVADLGTARHGEAIVASLLQLAHQIGATCVAEGVETEIQRDALVHNGCRLAQGYLFAHPVPATEFEQLLTADGTTPDPRVKAKIETTPSV